MKLKKTAASNSFNYIWLLRKIFPYIKPCLNRILINFLIALPLGLLDGVSAFAIKPYIDCAINENDFKFQIFGRNFVLTGLEITYILPIGIVLFATFQGILRYLNSYISSWTSRKITNNIKSDLYEQLIHMHPKFFDENSSGIIVSRYINDPNTASNGIIEQLKTMITSLFGSIGLIAVMLYSSAKLAIIGIFVLCAAFIPVLLLRKRIKDASNKNMIINGNIIGHINQTHGGNKVIASYSIQHKQKYDFNEEIQKAFNINMSLTKRTAWMSPLMHLIASFGIAIVLWYGTFLVNSNQITTGSFASFIASLLLLYKPVKTLGNTMTNMQKIFVALGRVFELFGLESEINEIKNPVTLSDLNHSIKFCNVVFEYDNNRPVLKNINLEIKKGETVAIVGSSGSGKSTLVNLLPRFYDIKSGSITIDDVDIRNITLNSLRNNIAMVFQDNFLFSKSIKENILLAKPDASDDELFLAIHSANLFDVISNLPDGIDTIISERGLTLSGGERQRIAIARAILKNAPIVILDEATSALDNKSEAMVQKAMANLMKDKTVFIIAHRLSTIQNADRIIVLEDGRIIETGCHNELTKVGNSRYRMLYEMQFQNIKTLSRNPLADEFTK